MSQRARGLQSAGLVLRTLAGQRDPTGGALTQAGQMDEERVARAAQARPRVALEQEQITKARESREAMQHPAYGTAVRTLLKKFSPATAQAAEGAPPQVLEHILGPAERAYAADQRRNAMLLLGGRGTGSASGESDITKIADAIEAGIQPPDVKGLYRFGAPVRAELSRRGFDLTTANREWGAVQRHMSSLNGPQQTRLRQSIDFAYHSLDQIEDLYNQWQRVGPASGLRLLNRGALATAKQLPGEAGAIAQGLEGQINDLVESLGSVYMGGNTPTDNAFKLASANLSGNWNEETFKKSLALVRNNLKMRQNAMMNALPAGLRADSPYSPGPKPQAEAAPPVAAPSAPRRRYNPQTGALE